MAKTKRVQVLMEPQEFKTLEEIAHRRGASVSELMREAARHTYLGARAAERRAGAARRFLSLPKMALPEWSAVKREIEARYDDALP